MPHCLPPLFLHLTSQLALCYLMHHPCVILLFCWPLIDVQTCVRRACVEHNPVLRVKQQIKNLSGLHYASPYSACNRKETKTRVFKNMRRRILIQEEHVERGGVAWCRPDHKNYQDTNPSRIVALSAGSTLEIARPYPQWGLSLTTD